LELLTKVEHDKELPEKEVLSHRAEIEDSRALALASAGRHEEAAKGFTDVAGLNRKLGRRAQRSQGASEPGGQPLRRPAEPEGQPRTKRLGRRPAATAFETELSQLMETHGVSTTKGKKIGALWNISQEVSLGDDSIRGGKRFFQKRPSANSSTHSSHAWKGRGTVTPKLWWHWTGIAQALPKEASVAEDQAAAAPAQGLRFSPTSAASS